VMNYYRHIDRSKVQFDFFISSYEQNFTRAYYEEEALSLGANIYRKPIKLYRPIKGMLGFIRLLKAHLEIKIVHVHDSNSIYPAKILLLSKLAGIPVRIAYSSSDERSQKRVSHKLMQLILRASATHYTAGSKEACLSMFGDKSANRFVKIPRARDLKVFRYDKTLRDSVRRELQLEDKLVIINVGRLDRVKNQTFLLDAFACAIKDNKEIILLFAGEGNQQPELLNKVAELQLNDNVRFLGTRNDVPNLLQAADIFALPSLYEGMPGAAIEAQAAGLPCLLSDTISPEIKITGLVEFLPIDKGPGVWAERILANKNFDRRDTTEDVRSAGYDIRDAAKWLEEFYLDLTGGLHDREA